MPSRFLIYGLIDPRSGELRYVGKSTSGMRRPRQHVQPCHLKNRTRTVSWVKALLAEGLKPDIEVLEVYDSAEALNEAEVFHIAYWRFLGVDLTNHTDGGDGGRMRGYRLSKESREKIAAAHRGMHHSTATRQKISDAQRGRSQSLETVERRVAPLRGRARPEHVRTAISRAKGGQGIVDESGVIYASCADAARRLALDASFIGKVVRGELKSVHGYTFRRVGASCS